MAHYISEEEVTSCLKTDRTIEQIMLEVRTKTGADNFIAVVNHLPKDSLRLFEEHHIYNYKYLEELKIFVRRDDMSPWP